MTQDANTPNPDDLAQQFMTLWQQQMQQMMQDPTEAAKMGQSFLQSAPWLAMMQPGQTTTPTHDTHPTQSAAPNAAEPAQSRQLMVAISELQQRLAHAEARIAELERQLNQGR